MTIVFISIVLVQNVGEKNWESVRHVQEIVSKPAKC